MTRRAAWVVFGLIILAASGARSGWAQDPPKPTPEWQTLLLKRLPALGHRNWIVIADSAYPLQTRAGIDTVVTNAEQLDVVKLVLEELEKTKHIRPVVYLDAEMPHVSERDAPGIGQYRSDLKKLLGKRKPRSLPHEEIIDRLDRAGEKFSVLILKTSLTLPYTSVFLELDCGYWSPEAEQRLREVFREGEKSK